MNSIKLETAKKILDVAFREAATRGVANAAVVVTDAGGNIRAAQRSDSWGAFGIDIALAKARTALGFSNSSLKVGGNFQSNPAAVIGINAAVDGRFIPLGGGIIVTNDQGDIIGAAGYSGGMADVDHAIIVAAVTEAGLKTPE
jgi:uncharacterized protein GlcG (DUF336 family)